MSEQPKPKSEMQKAIEDATRSVDERSGGKYDREQDGRFLKSLGKQMKERKALGKPLQSEDLSEPERQRLLKIAEVVPDLTEEELDIVALASKKGPEKKAA